MDPFTIAAGIGAVGSLFQGITGYFAAKSEKKVDQQNAQQHLQEAGVNADEALLQGNQAAARGATVAAASGGGLTGSAIDTINQLSQNAMFNARAQVYRGRTQANADIYQANVASKQMTNSLISGFTGAGSSILGGFMQSAQLGQQTKLLGTLKGLGADSPYDYSVPY